MRERKLSLSLSKFVIIDTRRQSWTRPDTAFPVSRRFRKKILPSSMPFLQEKNILCFPNVVPLLIQVYSPGRTVYRKHAYIARESNSMISSKDFTVLNVDEAIETKRAYFNILNSNHCCGEQLPALSVADSGTIHLAT